MRQPDQNACCCVGSSSDAAAGEIQARAQVLALEGRCLSVWRRMSTLRERQRFAAECAGPPARCGGRSQDGPVVRSRFFRRAHSHRRDRFGCGRSPRGRGICGGHGHRLRVGPLPTGQVRWRHLIAHELAHVAQQTAGAGSHTAPRDGAYAEPEARRAAAAAVHGRRVPALSAAAVAPARSAIPNKSGPRFSKVLATLRWTWSVADSANLATMGAEKAYAAITPQIIASTESRGVSLAQALILVAQAQTEQYATSQQPASARNRLFNMMPTQTEFDLWKKSLSAADRNKVFAGGDSKKSQPVDFLPAAGVSIKMYDSPEFDPEQNKLVMKQSPFFVYDSVEHSVEHFVTRMQGFDSGWYKPNDPAVKPLRERYRKAGVVSHLQQDDATAAGYGGKLKSINYATGKHYKEEISNRYRLVLGDFLKMIEDAISANDPSSSGSTDPETLSAYESLAVFRTELTAALSRTPFMVIPKKLNDRRVRSNVFEPDDHHEERAVSEPDEDFAAMFEASLKAKRFEKGQTIEGTIVAIGPEVAFVDVGGKGEATIEIDELKDAEGDLEVAVGDRIQADGGVDRGRADALPEAGARGRDRSGSSKTRSTPVFRWKARSNGR